MNKRNILKIILNFLSLILMMLFLIHLKDTIIVYLIPILFLITTYMYKYKNEIKKNKFIYDVILMIFMFFSSILLIYMIISVFKNIEYIITESQILFVIVNIYFISKILIDNLINSKKQVNKINDYLSIIVFLITNLVFIRYYLEISNIIQNSEKYYFVHQNHVYFFTMLLTIETHKYLTNRLK